MVARSHSPLDSSFYSEENDRSFRTAETYGRNVPFVSSPVVSSSGRYLRRYPTDIPRLPVFSEVVAVWLVRSTSPLPHPSPPRNTLWTRGVCHRRLLDRHEFTGSATDTISPRSSSVSTATTVRSSLRSLRSPPEDIDPTAGRIQPTTVRRWATSAIARYRSLLDGHVVFANARFWS